MSEIGRRYDWESPAGDPNDETFGDVVDPVRLDDDWSSLEAVLLGEPYDGAVIGRKGARAGPTAIRRELEGVKSYHFGRGPVGCVGDLGDAALPPEASVERAQEDVTAVTSRVHKANPFPVFLGGDNSMTVPNVSPLLDRGSVGAISIDAHLDCRAVEDGPSSGTPYRQLHERGLDALAVVGARHFETSTAYADYLRGEGGTIVTADDVRRDLDAAVETATSAIGTADAVYVSLDVDAIDGSAAPGVSAPTPGGLTSREAFELLEAFVGHERTVGFEVVECAPPLDRGNRTVRVAARAVAHALSAGIDGHRTPGDRPVTGGGDRGA